MAGIVYLILAFAIVGGVGALMYFNVVATPEPIQKVQGYLIESRVFPDGSSVDLLVSDNPDSINSEPIPQQVEVPKIVKSNTTDGYETVTEIKELEGADGVAQIIKTNPKGVVVQGYIKLMDATTGNPMKPYTYDVLVQIHCDDDLNIDDDGFNFCTTDSIFGRVQTDDAGKNDNGDELGGYFNYVWYPKLNDSIAFYDVQVSVTSDQKNSAGQYENYENSYKIQLVN